MSAQDVFSLYRKLYRASLQVFTHSKRSNQSLKLKIRDSFEEAKNLKGPEIQKSLERGYNTLNFLRVASDETSTEQKIVRSLCIMESNQRSCKRRPALLHRRISPYRQYAYDTADHYYNIALKHLNDSSNLGLR